MHPRPRTAPPGRAAVSWLAATAALMLPALWNGYPFVYWDSADYVGMALTGHAEPYRTPVYSLLILPFHAGISLWGVVVAQCGLAAWVLREALALALSDRRSWSALPAAALLLALASSLPWYAGQVMPDALAGLAMLAVAVLALRGDELPRPRRLGLALVLFAGAASHLTHLATAVALLMVAWLLRRGSRAATVAVAAAALAVPAANAALGNGFTLSAGGPVFLLARLVEDGLAARWLDQACGEEQLVLCAWKDDLPRSGNQFLWTDSPAFVAMGGWRGAVPEASRIVRGVARDLALADAASAARMAARQLVSLRTGDGIEPQQEPWDLIRRELPGDFPAFQAARQQQRAVPLAAINLVHQPLALAAQGLLPLLAGWAWRRGRRREAAFLALLATGLLANAIVCGALSTPGDRYQSRVAWVAVLAVGMVAAARTAHLPISESGRSRLAMRAARRWR